jgi:hypothetical protein
VRSKQTNGETNAQCDADAAADDDTALLHNAHLICEQGGQGFLCFSSPLPPLGGPFFFFSGVLPEANHSPQTFNSKRGW